ncbi:ORF6N domain-containing protein [Dysgonomonas mossii]|nr:ORF6N domain-containing protein [Dysgonomonas mossii]MBF0760156.1 ORF6N domain-containing protein [Dysgonomonas mossii]SBV90463.1 KilA-N, DNA-binding domain protein [uncultured Dysgonomonas sp.]SBV95803.1 KilA-N, DNA-binding domain protein [uncultured Dysgonomonas sp.]
MELQIIQNKIFEVRGLRVMIDFHLAELYQVETRALKQAVRRNIERFPNDFMFELTNEEALELINIGVSQSVIPSGYNVGISKIFAFTEQGVSMLSSVLRSKIAIEINISIMRAFVALRQYTLDYAELNQKLETFMIETNIQFNQIYQALTELASTREQNSKSRKRVGYIQNEEEG